MEPVVCRDLNAHTAIRLRVGRKKVLVVRNDNGYRLQLIPRTLFERTYHELTDYPITAAARKYLEHAALHGITERAKQQLEILAGETMNTNPNAATQGTFTWPHMPQKPETEKDMTTTTSTEAAAESKKPTAGKAKNAAKKAASKAPAKKAASKTATTKSAKKTATPQAKKDGPGRPGAAPKYPLTATITVVAKENPKRPGSKAHKEFEFYKKAKTVGDYVKMGGTLSYLNYDAKAGFIKVK